MKLNTVICYATRRAVPPILLLSAIISCSNSRFESVEPPFKVAFPTKPVMHTVDSQLPDGSRIKEHVFVSHSLLGDRIVIAAALPPLIVEQLSTPGAIELNLGDRAAYEARLRARHGRLIEFSMGKFGATPARFTRYFASVGQPEKPEEKTMLERSVYGPKHLYIQIFSFDPKEDYSFESPVARQYFDSFEIGLSSK